MASTSRLAIGDGVMELALSEGREDGASLLGQSGLYHGDLQRRELLQIDRKSIGLNNVGQMSEVANQPSVNKEIMRTPWMRQCSLSCK